MNLIDEYETFFIRGDKTEILNFLHEKNFLKSEMNCDCCNQFMKLTKYKRSIDGYAWRCYASKCTFYLCYKSARKESFFENLNISLSYIFRVICKYAAMNQKYQIDKGLNVSLKTIDKIINKLIFLMPKPDFSNDKLGKNNKLVQIDETMLNYKCKSHRGRSSRNKTDSISIIEFDKHIVRCFAQVIPNKKKETLVPIICNNVVNGATIYTDEHGSYKTLHQMGFYHGTVCHKYRFIDQLTGVNTQAVESFHNDLKRFIKCRKGVKTESRPGFLKEYCFYFNNRTNFFEAVLHLLKLN